MVEELRIVMGQSQMLVIFYHQRYDVLGKEMCLWDGKTQILTLLLFSLSMPLHNSSLSLCVCVVVGVGLERSSHALVEGQQFNPSRALFCGAGW